MSARRYHIEALSERGRYDEPKRSRADTGEGSCSFRLAICSALADGSRRQKVICPGGCTAVDRQLDCCRPTRRTAHGPRRSRRSPAHLRPLHRHLQLARHPSHIGELLAVARACRYLGADDPQLFKDALRAYDAAIAADSGNVDARVELGEMFLEKYNGPDARQMFAGVLRQNPFQPRALLGMAEFSISMGPPVPTRSLVGASP